ncbi:monophenol monooxygenase [Pseudoloma neurophilia]|uniref:Monophenol monooxygenase n=1 Tax=Pseudoloma neurophilia TaxID=146866 RepID=A0A0R0LTG5_9MICR|nr:monophenol monooxygenase [Pseudoloma neurophilia]
MLFVFFRKSSASWLMNLLNNNQSLMINSSNQDQTIRDKTNRDWAPENLIVDPFLQLKHLNFPLNPIFEQNEKKISFQSDKSEIFKDPDALQQIEGVFDQKIRDSKILEIKRNKLNKLFKLNKIHKSKIIRKEIRAMSPQELSNYLLAVYKLHYEGIIDDLSLLHLSCEHYAHNHSRFLPWHRALLLYYEMLLRLMVKDVVLPYWDWSLDSEDIKNSHIMKIWPISSLNINELDSKNDKNFISLKNLLFEQAKLSKTSDSTENNENSKKIKSPKSISESQLNDMADKLSNYIPSLYKMYGCWNVNTPSSHCLKRSTNFDVLYDTEKIFKMIERPFDQFASAFETVPHAIVHLVIGGSNESKEVTPGDMAMLYSCNDPIFFLHHAYCDYIWQTQQQKQLTKALKENLESNESFRHSVFEKLENDSNYDDLNKKLQKTGDSTQNLIKMIDKLPIDVIYDLIEDITLNEYTDDPDEVLFPFNMTVKDVWKSNVYYEPYKINYKTGSKIAPKNHKKKEVKELPESFIKRHRYNKRKVRRMERMVNERETIWDNLI